LYTFAEQKDIHNIERERNRKLTQAKRTKKKKKLCIPLLDSKRTELDCESARKKETRKKKREKKIQMSKTTEDQDDF
jgi:hypothetical protein